MTKEEYNNTKENVKKSYNIAAKNYHDLFNSEIDEHQYDRELLDSFAASILTNGKICDMGYGPSAQNAAYLFNKGYNVEGLDFSENCIANASENHPEMKFHLMDMTKTSFKNEIFDGIISLYSLFHIPKEYQNEAILEYYRILKPKGKLLIMNHEGNINQTFSEIWGHNNLMLFSNFSTEEEMKVLISKYFNILKIEKKPTYYGFPKDRIIIIAEKKMFDSPT
ncbi:MAG: hypothetical protein A2015_01500 [Spirochaetes bacterium GWF1_31_7]|nr:MAG: hypothetical protein A2Y29_09435 [Spirochaetes bacterium GWE2_31_10]OHD51136.1 MAG: hypothetical protein A2015_01500 [Spirochaetes bacterium GWF1_31_7]OHD80029.1 MAG: hypothetical protein A2355_09475 [Spirochaetes bacterium RIFOXYB1_FULL_32_8]HBD95034.1 hypothetical protein [Spirochaetia bacterium]HBI38983.1 hypothetical protein [Spirochaetia bacterium]